MTDKQDLKLVPLKYILPTRKDPEFGGDWGINSGIVVHVNG